MEKILGVVIMASLKNATGWRVARNKNGDIVGHTYRLGKNYCFFNNMVEPKRAYRCFKTAKARREHINGLSPWER